MMFPSWLIKLINPQLTKQAAIEKIDLTTVMDIIDPEAVGDIRDILRSITVSLYKKEDENIFYVLAYWTKTLVSLYTKEFENLIKAQEDYERLCRKVKEINDEIKDKNYDEARKLSKEFLHLLKFEPTHKIEVESKLTNIENIGFLDLKTADRPFKFKKSYLYFLFKPLECSKIKPSIFNSNSPRYVYSTVTKNHISTDDFILSWYPRVLTSEGIVENVALIEQINYTPRIEEREQYKDYELLNRDILYYTVPDCSEDRFHKLCNKLTLSYKDIGYDYDKGQLIRNSKISVVFFDTPEEAADYKKLTEEMESKEIKPEEIKESKEKVESPKEVKEPPIEEVTKALIKEENLKKEIKESILVKEQENIKFSRLTEEQAYAMKAAIKDVVENFEIIIGIEPKLFFDAEGNLNLDKFYEYDDIIYRYVSRKYPEAFPTKEAYEEFFHKLPIEFGEAYHREISKESTKKIKELEQNSPFKSNDVDSSGIAEWRINWEDKTAPIEPDAFYSIILIRYSKELDKFEVLFKNGKRVNLDKRTVKTYLLNEGYDLKEVYDILENTEKKNLTVLRKDLVSKALINNRNLTKFKILNILSHGSSSFENICETMNVIGHIEVLKIKKNLKDLEDLGMVSLKDEDFKYQLIEPEILEAAEILYNDKDKREKFIILLKNSFESKEIKNKDFYDFDNLLKQALDKNEIKYWVKVALKAEEIIKNIYENISKKEKQSE